MLRRPLSDLVRSSRFLVVLSIFSAAVALGSALQMRGEVRLVSIILLFGGGFGAMRPLLRGVPKDDACE
ncbi:MAG: hypothetical protein ACREM1_24365 [Longimicrobiales bacterium]